MSNVANGPGGKAEKTEHEKASPAAQMAQQGLPVLESYGGSEQLPQLLPEAGFPAFYLQDQQGDVVSAAVVQRLLQKQPGGICRRMGGKGVPDGFRRHHVGQAVGAQQVFVPVAAGQAVVVGAEGQLFRRDAQTLGQRRLDPGRGKGKVVLRDLGQLPVCQAEDLAVPDVADGQPVCIGQQQGGGGAADAQTVFRHEGADALVGALADGLQHLHRVPGEGAAGGSLCRKKGGRLSPLFPAHAVKDAKELPGGSGDGAGKGQGERLGLSLRGVNAAAQKVVLIHLAPFADVADAGVGELIIHSWILPKSSGVPSVLGFPAVGAEKCSGGKGGAAAGADGVLGHRLRCRLGLCPGGGQHRGAAVGAVNGALGQHGAAGGADLRQLVHHQPGGCRALVQPVQLLRQGEPGAAAGAEQGVCRRGGSAHRAAVLGCCRLGRLGLRQLCAAAGAECHAGADLCAAAGAEVAGIDGLDLRPQPLDLVMEGVELFNELGDLRQGVGVVGAIDLVADLGVQLVDLLFGIRDLAVQLCGLRKIPGALGGAVSHLSDLVFHIVKKCHAGSPSTQNKTGAAEKPAAQIRSLLSSHYNAALQGGQEKDLPSLQLPCFQHPEHLKKAVAPGGVQAAHLLVRLGKVRHHDGDKAPGGTGTDPVEAVLQHQRMPGQGAQLLGGKVEDGGVGLGLGHVLPGHQRLEIVGKPPAVQMVQDGAAAAGGSNCHGDVLLAEPAEQLIQPGLFGRGGGKGNVRLLLQGKADGVGVAVLPQKAPQHLAHGFPGGAPGGSVQPLRIGKPQGGKCRLPQGRPDALGVKHQSVHIKNDALDHKRTPFRKNADTPTLYHVLGSLHTVLLTI